MLQSDIYVSKILKSTGISHLYQTFHPFYRVLYYVYDVELHPPPQEYISDVENKYC